MVSIDPTGVPRDVRAWTGAGGSHVDDGSVAEQLAPSVPRREPGTLTRAKLLLAAADLATVLVVVVAADLAGLRPGARTGSEELLLVVLVVSWMLAAVAQRLYRQRVVQRPGQELRRIGIVAFAAALSVVSTAFLLELEPRRTWVVGVPLMVMAAMYVERCVARRLFGNLRAKGVLVRRVVLVGGSADLSLVLSDRRDLEQGGYRVVAVIDLDAADQEAPEQSVLRAVVDVGAGGILLTGSGMAPGVVRRLTRLAHDAGVHVELLSPLHDVAAQRITVHAIGSTSALYLEQAERTGWRRAAKRGFDLVVASTLLLLASPLLVAVAVAIKVDSRGPVLYRQERVGRDFVPFRIIKFRSMVQDADERRDELMERNEADGPLFKLTEDPRVTRVGRFIRRTSIDELPQLWNVVRGEMSMVGPRPGMPEEVVAWPDELAWRVRVTPGITGMWQVHGRSLASFEDYTRLDLYYVDNWSLATDLVLMAKTVPVVLLRRGAF